MKRLTVLLTLGLVFVLTVIPTFAIEEVVAETPQGIGWLFLFLGVGAIVTLGFVMFARERAHDQESNLPS